METEKENDAGALLLSDGCALLGVDGEKILLSGAGATHTSEPVNIDLKKFMPSGPDSRFIGYYIALNGSNAWEMEQGKYTIDALPPESANEVYAAVIDFNPEHYEMVTEQGADGMTTVKIKPKAI